MQCVAAAAHSACAVDCPNCCDYRNCAEAPWDDGGHFAELPLPLLVGARSFAELQLVTLAS